MLQLIFQCCKAGGDLLAFLVLFWICLLRGGAVEIINGSGLDFAQSDRSTRAIFAFAMELARTRMIGHRSRAETEANDVGSLVLYCAVNSSVNGLHGFCVEQFLTGFRINIHG